jgi:hypothetical protein
LTELTFSLRAPQTVVIQILVVIVLVLGVTPVLV